ncbi:MAG: preprotein translocase subunit SecY [Oscillospiraceae bacterium]|nr:preprotein translocase subunit SecY [Oscillospiraceae bacterium]
MFSTLRNAWKLPDLRKKLIFTMMMLLIYRIGNAIPVPYINVAAMSEYFSATLSDTILGLYNAMSGSAFSQASVLALGIQPYINASIIIQLLTIAIPALERWSKEEGEMGKKKIERLTRYTTVALGVLLGFAYYTMISSQSGIITNDGILPAIVIILAFAAGSSVVMWMGEQITEFGIGNGISMILFANIVASLPATANTLFGSNMFAWWVAIIIAVILLLLIVFIVFINDAERRIPIQYAKRVVGRKVYGGQNTNMPIKVSMSGVMPVIFAQSIVSLPATICTFIGKDEGKLYDTLFASNSWVYVIMYGLLIFFFSWFYSTIQYDPTEMSNNLKKNGGFIPGFRPGKPTADFIKKVINKIVVFGAVYLAIVALLPLVGGKLVPGVSSLAIGGTSVIIIVGVALETVQALEAQMLMRHYKGFLD